MSTTIDERVLEMRFDNKQFESGVSTTMSTLDKLKQKLQFSGATKGLENVSTAARKVDLSGIGNSAETVGLKFNAMYTIADQALRNITNSAMAYGKRIVSALTIDPIKTGFQEYETQINAVQTILANTSHQGTTIDDVNRALEELNKYADMTIYNFTEMTRNIGTFTAAGLDLDTSTKAIQGIANLAAVSGSTSQQASTAMYQLSQALSSGTVRLMDWNSVVNASMGGKVFQDAIMNTVRNMEGVDKAVVEAYDNGKSFRELLNPKDWGDWFTSDILAKTLEKFTETGAVEYLGELYNVSNDNLYKLQEVGKTAGFTSDEFKKMALSLSGGNESVAKDITDILSMANTATDAATKVKTFTQLWDVLKESAQSGWAQTWKLIVGDFEEAKALLTPLADTLTGFVNGISNVRNRILEIALDFTTPWTSIMDKLGNVKKVVDNVSKVTDKLEYFQDVVDRVWMGEFNNWGDNPDRRDLLTAAGYDHRVVQELVNLGEESWHAGQVYKLSIEEIEAAHKKYGLTLETTAEETEKAVVAFNELTDEKLKDAGLTEDEIALYRALEQEAARAGVSISDLADEMSKTNGRDLLIESFKNIGGMFIDIGKAIKSAWINIFNPPSAEVIGIRLYGIIRSLKEFTESLRLTDEKTGELTETGLKIQSVFKGIFAAIDIVLTVIGGPLKIALSAASQLLGFFGLGALDVAAFIGEAIVKLRDLIDGVLDFTKLYEKIVPPIQNAIETFRNWIISLRESENLPQDIAKGIVSVFDKIGDAIKNFVKKIPDYIKQIPELISGIFDGSKALPEWMKYFEIVGQVFVELGKIIKERVKSFLSRSEFAGISGDAIAGLIEGFKNGDVNVWDAAVEMVKNLVQKVKDFLGISSPSTVFAAIGGFIIAGLIAGLQNGIPDSLGAFKDIFQPMLDWIKGIDFGAVLAGIMGVGMTATAYKTAKAISAPLEGVGSMLGGLGEVFEGTGEVLKKSAKPIAKVIKSTTKVVKGFSNILNGVAFNIKADAIKTLGETLLLVVGAMVVLKLFKPAELWNAVGVIAALAVILGVLAFAMNKISTASATIGKDGIDIKGLSSGLIGIGLAILLLGLTVKMIGSMNPDQAIQGFAGLLGIVTAIALVIAAFGLLVKGKSAENIDDFGQTVAKIGVALLLMAVVAKILGDMDRGALIQGGIAMAAFVGIIVGLMAATKLISGSKNVDTIGSTLMKIAAAIGIMAIVAKMLGDMDRETLIQGGIAIVAFGGILVGLMAATKLINGSKNVDTIGSALLKMALAIGVMAIVAKMLGNMDPAEIIQGGLAITAFGGIIVGLMAATKLISGSKNVEKIGGAILAVSGAIAIMAMTAFMLSMISWEGFAKGTTMVTIFAGIIVGLMAATKLVGKDADKIGKTILTIAGAIGAIALIAILLSLVPDENLKKGLTIITLLSLIVAGLIAVTGLSKNCMSTVLAITAVIAVLAGAMWLLSTLPTESVIASAVSLGGLLVVMAGVMTLLALLGDKVTAALPGIGVLALLGLVVAELAIVLGLMAHFNVEPSIETAAALSVLLIAMSGVLAILTGIGSAATLAYPAMGALAVLIAGFAVLLGALGALMTYIPNAEQFLDKGIVVMEKIGTAIGAFVGGLIGGIAAGVASSLPAIATSLSDFMANLEPFIAGIKNIDDKVLVGAGILAATILALSVADFITGILSLGGISLVGLGLQLSAFMVAAKPFIDGAKTLTPEILTGVKALAETILILTAANVLDGLTSWLTGGSSLENFAAQLPVLGQSLSAFSENLGSFTDDQLNTVNCAAKAVKTLASAAAEIPNTGGLLASLVGENDLGVFAAQFPVLGSGLAQFLANIGTFTDEQVATVTCAAQAIKLLAEASAEIPNTGGLLGQLVGENDLGIFAAQFPMLGTGLAKFLTNVGTFTDEQVATVDCAAQAVKTLASAASEIPNSGGWIGAILGENDLGRFASQFPLLGTGLAGFLTNVGTFTDAQISTVECAASAVKTLAGVASSIPNEGGWISKIVGDNNLGTFASNFPSLGKGLAGFASELGTFTSSQVTSIKAAVTAIQALTGLANSDLKGAVKHLSDFGKDLPSFGKNIGSFCTNMPTTSSTTSAVNNLNKILGAVKSIASANTGPLATFAENLKKIGKDAVRKFVEAFTSDSAKTDLKNAAKKLGDKVVDGIEAKESDIKDAAKKASKKAVSGAETQKEEMKSAGKDLGKGLVKGIEAKWDAAYDAGYTLGQKAVQGEKDGQKSKSPSKLTIRAGKWLGEGLVIGMGKMATSVYSAGRDLGKAATDSLSSTISRIADAVNTDIDAQPTIRPVLDLSDVRAGAGMIGSMLGGDTSVGVLANVGSISNMMNNRSQNGSNADIVHAIDKLSKKMDNVGNTTNIIEGVTYDDGSNIHSTVADLIRAVKMGGRA
jgi:tape measure domain-containing protein